MAGASAPPPGAGGRNDGRGSGLMAETGSTSPSAVGNPDFTGWDTEDIQQWQQCSALNVLDEFWSPVEWLTTKKGKAVRRALKRGQRDHNAAAIKRARQQVRIAPLLMALCAAAPHVAHMSPCPP